MVQSYSPGGANVQCGPTTQHLKLHLEWYRVQPLFHSSQHKSPYTLQSTLFSPQKNCPFMWWNLNLIQHIVHWASLVHIPNGISISSAVFEQLTADGLYTTGCPFSPSNLSIRTGASAPPCNVLFPGANLLSTPNSISISSVVFAGITIMTHRQTTLFHL